MKLKVGMYVRTDGKFLKLDENNIDGWKSYFEFTKKEYKANYDLLELIKPLDLMFIDIEHNDNCGGLVVVPRIAETINELEEWKERIRSGECKLVMIATSQQINEICYEVSK